MNKMKGDFKVGVQPCKTKIREPAWHCWAQKSVLVPKKSPYFCIHNRNTMELLNRSPMNKSQPEDGQFFKPLSFKCRSVPQTHRVSPCYVSFVNGATLWDRGVYHYTLTPPSHGPSLPCPRFAAHMKSSPGSLGPPGAHRSKPQSHPCDSLDAQRNQARTARSSNWSCAVFNPKKSAGHVQHLIVFDRASYKKPSSPAPSTASHAEDNVDTQNCTQPVTQPIRDYREEEEYGELEVPWADTCLQEDDAELDKLDQLRESITPALSSNEESLSDFSRPPSSAFSRSTSLHSGRTSQKSGISDLGQASSTPLSQLRTSSIFLSAFASSDSELDPETPASTGSEKDTLNKTLLLGSSYHGTNISSNTENLNLSKIGCHSNATGPLQEQTISIGKHSQSERTPSFVEIWHDRVLNHWPVLPPISPERDPSELSSKSFELSNVQSDVSDELEGIVPRTGSSLSQPCLDSRNDQYSSPGSALLKGTSSQDLVGGDEPGPLSDIRLLLLDHQSWGGEPLGGINGSEADTIAGDHMGTTANFESDILGGYNEIHSNGFPFHHAPAVFKENRPADTCPNNGRDDQRSICTMTPSKTGCRSPSPSSPARGPSSSNLSTSNSFSSEERDSQLQSTALPSSDNKLDVETEVEHCIKPSLKTADGGHTTGWLSDSSAPRKEDPRSVLSCPVKGEKSGEAVRRGQGHKKKPLKLDCTWREEREKERLAEERQAKIFQIYTKLRENKTSRAQSAEAVSISKFEDFDFLAKYCIFSQEKLAKYKRAFEAADSDGDGYLTCFQVLVALKEIVPPSALTDAEEIYVYRV
ncbi:uncharacterized protein LOC131697472 [Acipenser ruthenus]|uniref:uncharacterized protein LOC131697472 n=1 Tax=Acipenser ruthenus TaxID=7906 RepID=UPI002740E6F0|nr:uncharacterized protein LOC131697472 [Acipenser ruthenus]